MDYNFGCMIASDTLFDFDSRDVFRGLRYAMKTADFEVLKDVAKAIIFGFLYMGCTLRLLANTTEPFMCGGDAALCQISLTTCLFLYVVIGVRR